MICLALDVNDLGIHRIKTLNSIPRRYIGEGKKLWYTYPWRPFEMAQEPLV